MRLKIFLLLFTVILSLKSNALVCTACASGNYTNAATWSCGCVPSGFDQINIPFGCTVTISSAVNLTTGGPPAPCNTLVNISGVLYFSGNASRLDMVATAAIVLNVGAKITTSDSTNNSQKINIGGGTAEWDSKNGTLFGPLIISNIGLPIELLDFSGTCVNSGIQISWSTATELDNESFLIEKSSNGMEWSLVTKIPGNGTTGTVHHYIHTDYEVNPNELRYYRLSQIDKDQTKTIFKAIDVKCGNKLNDQMVLFSNPASSELNVLLNVSDISTNNIIRVTNNLGQIVMESKVNIIKGLNTFLFPIDLNTGTYHILFSSDHGALPSQKLIVVK